jgi:hypothetical protein
MLYNYIIYDDIISLNTSPKIELCDHKKFLFALRSVPTICHNENHGYIQNLSVKRCHNANHGYIQNLSVKPNSHIDRLIATNTLHAFQTEANRIYTGILC